MKLLAVVMLCLLSSLALAKLENGDCEVCIKFLNKLYQRLDEKGTDMTDVDQVESQLMKFCKGSKDKEERFCYYIGGLATSATKLLNIITKPMAYHLPAEKLCEKLKKQDKQICDLRYDAPIDIDSLDLTKMKVKELKKILNQWDETCHGCVEKSDFITHIRQVKHKHVEL
ncbi:mesencephalic astrocyte-derived neurotrophic factor homolog [Dysidea avara]|uniref:mesencephalic astrocyte-derived neurotrophic factor homolog n=1 Tax=Dysidea avara TaxID=196820 RepID=UPI00332A2522